MDCPKCHSKMESVKYNNIEVDRCTNCQGIWFDMLENEQLKKMEGSEAIDTGDVNVGKEQDKIGDIDCPKCKNKLLKMVDPDQPHIWFEKCSTCYGLYFDAGEFKDFKEENFLDLVKDVMKGERK